jgi:hypothetical protein
VLAMAGILFLAGAKEVLVPDEMVVVHGTNDGWGWPESSAEYVTKQAARVYGALAIFTASGLTLIVLYPRRNKDQR